MSTYNRLPVTFDHGEGALLWDTRGREYLDALSGIAVCNLGPVSYTHLTLPTTCNLCRSRWSAYH